MQVPIWYWLHHGELKTFSVFFFSSWNKLPYLSLPIELALGVVGLPDAVVVATVVVTTLLKTEEVVSVVRCVVWMVVVFPGVVLFPMVVLFPTVVFFPTVGFFPTVVLFPFVVLWVVGAFDVWLVRLVLTVLFSYMVRESWDFFYVCLVRNGN